MSSAGNVTVDGGDFTLLKYVATLDAEALERTVGFDRGRLKSGFTIVALASNEILAPDDFQLGASSRYSGGVVKQAAAGQGVGIEAILTDRGQDIAELKKKVAAFFASRGGNTPAKVLPNLRHTSGMKYPDAEALAPGVRSGVPQFKLLVPKKFVILRDER
jgi:hypothetical protein